MTTAIRIGFPSGYAWDLALEFVKCLEPGVGEIVVAGSLRRGKEQVKDIEIVACLREDLPVHLAQHALDKILLDLYREKVILLDALVKRNGPKYKRFITPGAPDLPIELFLAQRANFGNILAIRTGDAEFSKAMMTPRQWGGLLPKGMRQKEGFLWQEDTHCDGGLQIECPTESHFFAALGVPTLPPAERDIKAISRLRAGFSR